jgi:hypothetical protein
MLCREEVVVREEDVGYARGALEAAKEVTEDVRDGVALAGDEEGAAEAAAEAGGSGAAEEEAGGAEAAAGAGSDDVGAGEDTASGANDCVLRAGSEIDDTGRGREIELCGGSKGGSAGTPRGSFGALA